MEVHQIGRYKAPVVLMDRGRVLPEAVVYGHPSQGGMCRSIAVFTNAQAVQTATIVLRRGGPTVVARRPR